MEITQAMQINTKPLLNDRTIEIIAAVLGALGALFLASNTALSPYGYLIWVPANIASVVLFRRKKLNGMAMLFGLHMAISILGIIRWLG